MTNPYELMMRHDNHQAVLQAAATISPAALQVAAQAIRDEEIPELAMYALSTCHSVGVQKTLIDGCLLELSFLATEMDGRRELFEHLLEDLQLSRTQGYRCRAVWKCFGARLQKEGGLWRQFRSESLKILSEDRTPEVARNEAVERARSGERITIKLARSIQHKHEEEGTVTVAATRSPSRTGWLFVGSVVRIQVRPTGPHQVPDVELVISDLESAIDELRNIDRPAQIAS